MAAVPPTGGPKNVAAPEERWALPRRHYNSRTKRRSSFWKKPRKFGGRMWQPVGLLGIFRGCVSFCSLFVLFCVLFRAISPSCPHVVLAPSVRPFFCLALLRRHKTRQLLGATADTVAPRGTSVLSDPGSSASSAMLSPLSSTLPPASSLLSPDLSRCFAFPSIQLPEVSEGRRRVSRLPPDFPPFLGGPTAPGLQTLRAPNPLNFRLPVFFFS